MVVALNTKLQVFLKTFLLNNICLLTNISMAVVSSVNPFLLGSVWFTIYHCIWRFLYMYSICYRTKIYVTLTLTQFISDKNNIITQV